MTHGRLESNLPRWQDSVSVAESGVQRTREEGETSGPWAVASGAVWGWTWGDKSAWRGTLHRDDAGYIRRKVGGNRRGPCSNNTQGHTD